MPESKDRVGGESASRNRDMTRCLRWRREDRTEIAYLSCGGISGVVLLQAFLEICRVEVACSFVNFNSRSCLPFFFLMVGVR
jgi:hypothetical protein